MTPQSHAFVVLAYGESPFLAEAVASVQAQTVQSRVMIATSTPCDHIKSVAATYGAHIAVNRHRDGIAGDWNFALTATGARYVTLVHQDDVYRPTFLARTLDLFARHPEGVVAFTGYQEVDDTGAPKSSKISRVKHLIELATLGGAEAVRGLRLRAFLSFGNPLPCSSATFDRARLPDFAFEGAYASNLDWEAWRRLMLDGHTFLRAPERLVGRRHNALTATSQLIRDGRRRTEDLDMFRKLWPAPIAQAIALVYTAGY